MRAASRLLGSLLLAVLLLAAFLRGTEPARVWELVKSADPVFLFLSGALTLVHLLVRAVRWRALLPEAEGQPLPVGPLFRYTTIGYAVNFALPGRLGEIVRPGLVWRRHGVPAGEAAASILLERALDVLLLALLLLAFPLASSAKLPAGTLGGAVVVGAVVCLGLVALGATSLLAGAAVDAWLARLGERFQSPFASRILALLRAGVSGLAVLRRPGAAWRLPLLSLLTWLPVLLSLHAALRAVGCQVPPAATLALVPLTAVGIAVPTPAGIGGYHAMLGWGLREIFAVPPDAAAAAAVVAHAVAVVPVLALGLYLLARTGLRPGRLNPLSPGDERTTQ